MKTSLFIKPSCLIGLAAVCFVLSSCETNELLSSPQDCALIQRRHLVVSDTIHICEQQMDSSYYWDDGNLSIPTPSNAHATVILNDSIPMEVVRTQTTSSIEFQKTAPRTMRDSVAHMQVNLAFSDGSSSSKTYVLHWKGINIPDSLWNKVTLQPAKVTKITMNPGEKRSIQFTWSYPRQLNGLIIAEVANQDATQSTPDWKAVAADKRKYTSSWVYGQNQTARFRLVSFKGQKEVSFAVISK